MHARHALRAALVAVVLVTSASAAHAQVCYRLPFTHVGDPWGCTSACGRTSPHRGTDFPQPSGTPVPAVADGVVRLVTTSSCLGNVVVVAHADGMFSGYCHLSAVSVGAGANVSSGQTIGNVGSTGTCTTGPHLHLTMSDHESGYWTGSTVDGYAYITSHTTCNRAPRGYLDTAACTGIGGWAQDQDTPDAPIDVHVYFDGPAGSPDGHGYPTHATISRPDLCTAIGSCEHGFHMTVPPQYFDDTDHAVYAYGIDAMGGANPLLGDSPRTLHCAPALFDSATSASIPAEMIPSDGGVAHGDGGPVIPVYRVTSGCGCRVAATAPGASSLGACSAVAAAALLRRRRRSRPAPSEAATRASRPSPAGTRRAPCTRRRPGAQA